MGAFAVALEGFNRDGVLNHRGRQVQPLVRRGDTNFSQDHGGDAGANRMVR
jgi:hypothetical protein